MLVRHLFRMGEPIIGANVLEKGTTNGIITNLDGEFTLNAPANATLVISYIGYEPINVTLNGRTSLKIQMKEEALALETVVVTAMGIKKKEASLTYSTQQVGGDELTRAKDPNMINALAGKTAGVSSNGYILSMADIGKQSPFCALSSIRRIESN